MPRELKLNPSKLILRGIISSDCELTKAFRCGNSSMEAFLHDEAYVCHILREASTTLVLYGSELAAYYTLRRQPIKIQPESGIIPRDALDLARLAVANKFKGNGLGTYLIKKIKELSYQINERYVTTDALFDKWQWYKRRGFEPLIDEEIDPDKTNGLVYMAMDLYDEKLIEEYCDV